MGQTQPWLCSHRHTRECQLGLGKCLGSQEPWGWPGSPARTAQPGQGSSHRRGHLTALEREKGGKRGKRIKASKAPAQLSSGEHGHGRERSWGPQNLQPSHTDLGLWEGGLTSAASPQQRQGSAHPIPQKERHHAPKHPAGARPSLLHSRMCKRPAPGSPALCPHCTPECSWQCHFCVIALLWRSR